jgi:transposase-like protein
VTWSAAERAEWLRLFYESGQTAADFCRDNELSPATLSIWRQQLPQAGTIGESLVEVPRQALQPTPPNQESVAACSVTLPSGLRFDVSEGLDMVWFGRLLQTLVGMKL